MCARGNKAALSERRIEDCAEEVPAGNPAVTAELHCLPAPSVRDGEQKEAAAVICLARAAIVKFLPSWHVSA